MKPNINGDKLAGMVGLICLSLGMAYAAHAQCPVETSYPDINEIRITQDTTLNPQCDYKNVQFLINMSDQNAAESITFDCDNALLYSDIPKDSESGDPGFFRGAIDVYSLEAIPKKVQSVYVKNCNVKDWQNGIKAYFKLTSETRDLYVGISNDDTLSYSEKEKLLNELDEELRPLAPSNVTFRNIWLKDNAHSGFYFFSRTNNITVKNSSVIHNGHSRGHGPGIYLDSGSQNITIENSVIKSSWREGIAIDASAFNTIKGNTFEFNRKGGIHLYKNCHEYPNKPGSVTRPQHSHSNLIEGNTFKTYTTTSKPVAVLIGKRQDKDQEGPDKCGDPIYYQDGSGTYFRDYAENNIIRGNIFHDGRGISVKDDGTLIQGNTFYDTPAPTFPPGHPGNGYPRIDDTAITVGSRVRQGAGEIVRDTWIEDNYFDPDFVNAVKYAYGSVPSTRASVTGYFSDGFQFESSSFTQKLSGWSPGEHWLAGDFDGDGAEDLAHVYGAHGKARVWLHLSTKNGFEYQSSFTTLAGFSTQQRWLVGDVDGDGLDDLVNVYGSGRKARAWVHRSTGNGFEYKSSFTVLAGFSDRQRWRIGDFNGDGLDDLVNVYGYNGQARAWLHLSNGNGFEYRTSFTVLAGYSALQIWTVGDANGDGQDDLINIYGNNGQARAWVHHSTGSAFEYKSSFTVLAGFSSRQKWKVSDINGDGRDDLINIYPNYDNARVWTHHSTGNSFEYKSSFQTLGKFADEQTWVVGNFDGDTSEYGDLLKIYDGS